MKPEDWLRQGFAEVIDPGDLRLDRAKKIARLASSHEYSGVVYVETRRDPNGREAVVVDVEVSLGQVRPVNDIKSRERIAAICEATELPAVISLRSDFPDLPHINVAHKDTPRSFCLYDGQQHELLREWSSLNFFERVRWWLVSNAYGELHGDDQPLDPILFGGIGFTLIVPDHLLANEFEGEVRVEKIGSDGDNLGILQLREAGGASAKQGILSGAVVLTTQPKPHGRIRYAPVNLLELQEFDHAFGVNIVETLETKLREWMPDKQELLNQPLMILLLIPLEREADAGVELVSKRAFWTTHTAGEIGRALGLMGLNPGDNRWVLIIGDKIAQSLDQMTILMGDVRSSFSVSVAAAASGLDLESPKFTQIGVGALGSQIALTLAQEGYGSWTYVDNDRLLPHNLARHALPFYFVGHNKAIGLSMHVSRMLNDPDYAGAISCNVLHPGNNGEKLVSAMQEAEVILDTSASVSVSRWLAMNSDRNGPVVSFFFNPRGTDLVMLWEGMKRSARLDDLEFAYYANLILDEKLIEHLASPPKGINYSTSCREPSMQMPQSRVMRLVGIAAEQLRHVVGQEKPAIAIWRDYPSGLALIHTSSPPIDYYDVVLQGWHIRCSAQLLENLQKERKHSGDVETGGVLVGSWDREKKIIYVAGILGPPPDSIQTKSGFVRGAMGLAQAISGISKRTMGNLGYVGEWHSHPEHHKSHVSTDDRNFLRHMKDLTQLEDSPALMMIGGDDGVRCAVMSAKTETEESTLLEI